MYRLQANDMATPEALRPVLLKLALRLISSGNTPSYFNPDRFYVHLLILRELEMYDDAATLLNHEIGQKICETSLVCDEIRRDIMKLKGACKQEGEQAKVKILEKKYVNKYMHCISRELNINRDRNWLEFLSLLDATFWDIASTSEPASEDVKAAVTEEIAKTRKVFSEAATVDGLKDRSGLLALLELEKRTKSHGLWTGTLFPKYNFVASRQLTLSSLKMRARYV